MCSAASDGSAKCLRLEINSRNKSQAETSLFDLQCLFESTLIINNKFACNFGPSEWEIFALNGNHKSLLRPTFHELLGELNGCKF